MVSEYAPEASVVAVATGVVSSPARNALTATPASGVAALCPCSAAVPEIRIVAGMPLPGVPASGPSLLPLLLPGLLPPPGGVYVPSTEVVHAASTAARKSHRVMAAASCKDQAHARCASISA